MSNARFSHSQAPFPALTAQEALSGWFGLLSDLDTLQPAYIDEDMGNGALHDALEALTAQIMAYTPANADEARAVIAIVSHDERDFELSDDQRQARARAFLLLDIIASGNRGSN